MENLLLSLGVRLKFLPVINLRALKNQNHPVLITDWEASETLLSIYRALVALMENPSLR